MSITKWLKIKEFELTLLSLCKIPTFIHLIFPFKLGCLLTMWNVYNLWGGAEKLLSRVEKKIVCQDLG